VAQPSELDGTRSVDLKDRRDLFPRDSSSGQRDVYTFSPIAAMLLSTCLTVFATGIVSRARDGRLKHFFKREAKFLLLWLIGLPLLLLVVGVFTAWVIGYRH
jgi:hypothetical protein